MSESPEFLPKPSSISTGEAPSSPPRKRQNAKEVETPDPSRVCDICNKVFTTSIYARKHRVTHSSKRPFSCRPCNKDYWRKDQLQAHVKRCHGTNQVDYHFIAVRAYIVLLTLEAIFLREEEHSLSKAALKRLSECLLINLWSFDSLS